MARNHCPRQSDTHGIIATPRLNRTGSSVEISKTASLVDATPNGGTRSGAGKTQQGYVTTAVPWHRGARFPTSFGAVQVFEIPILGETDIGAGT